MALISTEEDFNPYKREEGTARKREQVFMYSHGFYDYETGFYDNLRTFGAQRMVPVYLLISLVYPYGQCLLCEMCG